MKSTEQKFEEINFGKEVERWMDLLVRKDSGGGERGGVGQKMTYDHFDHTLQIYSYLSI